MPKATVNADGTKIDLRTCPGGFVTLRQLSFGQMLKRRDMAAKYMQEFGTGRDTTNRITIDILNEASRKYDFAHCIIDHNLEDDSGNKLDFSNAMSLDILDPKIAAEIENEIDKLNLTDFDSENFTTPSESSSTVIGNGSQKEEASVPPTTT
jgi:hypothetical protein